MNRLRQNFLFIVAGLSAAAVAGETRLLSLARERAGRALGALEQKKQERDRLARQSPVPSEESERAIAADLAAVRVRLAELRDSLQPRPPAPLAGPVPAQPMDAFFELANLVEKARAQAIATHVTLRPEERFGFTAYANAGPAPDLLAPVHRQQRAVQSVLEPLFESRPLALLGVRRAPPPAALQAGRSAGEDFFTIEPGLSVRAAGLVDTEPVRLEFTGQTSTLRALLNGLAVLRHPVVVRSVEVEPLPPADGGRVVAEAGAPVPVVRRSLSKFAVTVEFVQLAAVPEKPAS
ncbi:MAG: hypothetical protein ACOZE5_02025 [Verrucomicrobiota bacterium]